MSQENNSCGNFWLGFFLGGIIGAFLIFVFGTKEGKKMLEKILERAEDYEEELEEKVAKLQKHGEDLLEEARSVKDKVIKEIEEDKKDISTALITKMDQTLSKIEDIQKKGVELTKEVHHHYFKKNGKPIVS